MCAAGKHNDASMEEGIGERAAVRSTGGAGGATETSSPPRPAAKLSFTSAAAGFFGGCLTSAFGTGGPAILVYAREIGWETERFRANMQIIFFCMNTMTDIQLYNKNVITVETMKMSLRLLPATVLGGWIGSRLAGKLDKDSFRMVVLTGLGVMGVAYLFKAFRDMPHVGFMPHHVMNARGLLNMTLRANHGIVTGANNAETVEEILQGLGAS